jgi:hypothetical protein
MMVDAVATRDSRGGMPDPLDRDSEAAVNSAIALRRRLRALAMGQPEAFDMVFYHLGSNHPSATVAYGAGRRLDSFIMLLADLAWVHGRKDAHEAHALPEPPEVAEVRRVYRAHAETRRQYLMTAEQQAAVMAYLDALVPILAGCAELDEHAPSRTLARESARFNEELGRLRDAVI